MTTLLPTISEKSTFMLLQEYVERAAGPCIRRIFTMAATFLGIYGAMRFISHLTPGAHHLPKLDLHNKTVLITGASIGLGRALAIEFYSRGAKLILASRSLDKLEQLCAELENLGTKNGWENPNRPDFGYLDLNNGSATSIEKQVEVLIRDKKAQIDVLVNNAGVSNRGSCFDTSMSVQRRVMEVNFFGHVAITRALLNNIPDEGAIIAISSVQGKVALPNRSAYSASKHALEAFFKSLRAEERFGRLQILIVSAGYMNTGFGTRALNTEGHPVGVEDRNQLRGMAPELAALKIADALERRESELILAPCYAKLAVYASVLAPRMLSWLLARRALKEDVCLESTDPNKKNK